MSKTKCLHVFKNRKITLSEQEIPAEKWVDIPDEVRHIYAMWRPTPLYRAYGLEKALDTPAKIYYKYEGVSPSGSHKPNTTVAQAFYNKQEGVSKTILFNMCGHGYFDMKAYEDYFEGKIGRHELTTEEINASLAELDTPKIPQ